MESRRTGVYPDMAEPIFFSLLGTHQNLPYTLRSDIFRYPGTCNFVERQLVLSPGMRQNSVGWCLPFILERTQLELVYVKKSHKVEKLAQMRETNSEGRPIGPGDNRGQISGLLDHRTQLWQGWW